MRQRIPFQRIDVLEAGSLLERDDVYVLDVRDRVAFSQGHIAEAHNITFSTLSDVIDNAPRDMAILIYCYHGHASQEFAQALSDFGFREVYSLDGGFEAWRALGQDPVPSTPFVPAFAAAPVA